MSHGARRMKRAVSPPSPRRTSQKSVEATRQAHGLSRFSSSSLKTGTNAEESAGVGHERANEVRDLERDREGVDRALDAEVAPDDDLADEPEDPGGARGDGEDGGRAGEAARRWRAPVARPGRRASASVAPRLELAAVAWVSGRRAAAWGGS